jgi:hypothetical protein
MCQCACSFVVSKSMAVVFQRHCHFSRVGLGDDEPVHETRAREGPCRKARELKSTPCKADHRFELILCLLLTLLECPPLSSGAFATFSSLGIIRGGQLATVRSIQAQASSALLNLFNERTGNMLVSCIEHRTG